MDNVFVRASIALCIGLAAHGARASVEVVPLAGPIATAASAAWAPPSIASDGTDFLVAWDQDVNGTRWVFFARVSGSGEVLDPAGIPLAPGWGPAVAHGGGDYLVVWASRGSTAQAIRGARVDSGGQVVRNDLEILTTRNASPGPPGVAFDGSNYLVAWYEGVSSLGNVWTYSGMRVSAEGTPLDSANIALSPQYATELYEPPSVAAAGGDFLVVWDYWRVDPAAAADPVHPWFRPLYSVFGTRVGPDGNVLDPGGFAIATPAWVDGAWRGFFRGVAAFDSSSYLVVYPTITGDWDPVSGGSVLATRVGPDGVVDPASIVVGAGPAHFARPALVFDGHNHLVVLNQLDVYGGPEPVVGLRMTAAGAAFESIPLSASGANPAIGWNGASFLAAWTEEEADGTVTLRGAILGASVPVAVSTAGEGVVTSSPAGIDCGTLCAGSFYSPGTVTLHAAPAAGFSFTGWTGDCTGADPTCTLATDVARSATATFADAAAPVVTVPGRIDAFATSAGGAVVTFTATAWDAASGTLVPACTPASGSLFAPGVTQVECVATDAAGNVGRAGFEVAVAFGWSGILPPIDPGGASLFKLGRTVPVKFMLAGPSGGIPNLTARLYLAKISDGVVGTIEEADSTAGPDSGNVFRYDAAGGLYIFNLATSGLSAGTWQLRVDLGDGLDRFVLFSLRR